MKLYDIEGGESSALENTNELSELTETQKEYIKELDVPSSDWKTLLPEEKAQFVSDIKERMEEIGISDFEGQDKVLRESGCSPELLSEFRKEMYDEKMSALESIGKVQELTLDELKEECPQMYETVQRMNERLEGGDIMPSLHYYKNENGDFVLKSDLPVYANTHMIVSGGVIYAKSGCDLKGNVEGFNYRNECINTTELLPNTAYVIDGRSVYEHDSRGRLIKETTVYSSDFSEKQPRDTSEQARFRDGKDAIEGDESSHSVPHCLGGSNESINQLPVSADINRGEGSEWRANENNVTRHVREGDTVYVEHTYSYEGESKRPINVTSETYVDGYANKLEFDNRR